MSRFKNIDAKLEELSEKFGVVLTKDRSNYPEALRTFEERRVDWVENGINKAIIIQPTFRSTGVDSSIWNFINLAWILKRGVAQKPGWSKNLVYQMNFEEIEDNIDSLIDESIKNLQDVQMEDIIYNKNR